LQQNNFRTEHIPRKVGDALYAALKNFFLITAAILAFSCKSTPKPFVAEQPVIKPPAEKPPVEKQPEISESIIKKVQKNSYDINKYLYEDKGGNYFICADVEGALVTYDLKNAGKGDDNTFEIPYTIKTQNEELNDKILWKPDLTDGALVLSFDDDYFKNWERYFYIFKKYNANVTFFVQGAFNDFSEKAKDNGHEIGYHTKSHPDLRKLDHISFAKETETNNFIKHGITINSFAYPFGFYEEWMNDTLKSSYKLMRGFGTKLVFYNKKTLNANFVRSKSVDNIIYKNDNDFYDDITFILRAVCFTNSTVFLTTHNIADYADWGIKPSRLEFILKTAKELNIKLITFNDFNEQ
jgi:peptidoglycan/xylan/chitin deacetylase (PgdA/CDA1 family)